MFGKNTSIVSKKLMQAARGRSCVNCGTLDGTIVRAHYTGIRQHAFGKGMGQKGHDLLTADLCCKCHSQFDQYKGASAATKIDLSEQFLYCIALTLVRDWNCGVIQEGKP